MKTIFNIEIILNGKKKKSICNTKRFKKVRRWRKLWSLQSSRECVYRRLHGVCVLTPNTLH